MRGGVVRREDLVHAGRDDLPVLHEDRAEGPAAPLVDVLTREADRQREIVFMSLHRFAFSRQ
jgi:hypothetical protein